MTPRLTIKYAASVETVGMSQAPASVGSESDRDFTTATTSLCRLPVAEQPLERRERVQVVERLDFLPLFPGPTAVAAGTTSSSSLTFPPRTSPTSKATCPPGRTTPSPD